MSGPDPRIVFIKVGPDGALRGMSRVDPAVASHHQLNWPADIPLEPAAAALLDGTMNWRWVDGALVPYQPPENLDALRAEGQAQIDRLAEAMRLRSITPGSGQALEYAATLAEATAALAAPDPLDPASYPWLVAEQTAQSGIGTAVTLRAVAAQVVAQQAAWVAVGAAIKAVRREAKLRIASATSAVDINSVIRGVVWPAP